LSRKDRTSRNFSSKLFFRCRTLHKLNFGVQNSDLKIVSRKKEMENFKADMLHKLTMMDQKLDHFIHRCINMDMDQKRMQEEQRYVEHQRQILNQRKITYTLAHRNQTLSMLTSTELMNLGKTKINQFPHFNQKGQCINASSEAFSFFTSCHTLMNAQIIEAILIPSRFEGKRHPLRFYDGDKISDKISPNRLVVTRDMQSFRYEYSTVWEADDIHEEDIGVAGCSHTVVLVQTADAKVVLVDWSCGQFHEMDLVNARLYFQRNKF